MSIFNKIKKNPAPAIEKSKDEKPKGIKPQKEKQDVKDFKKGRISKDRVGLIILEPVISEKSSLAAALGKYVFKVADSANKSEVKKAVESFYNVNVTDVNISKTAEKPRRRGRIIGQKAGFKKAIVTLKQGESIQEIKS